MSLAFSKRRVRFYHNEVILVRSQQDETYGLLFDIVTGQLVFFIRLDFEGNITSAERSVLDVDDGLKYQRIYQILQADVSYLEMFLCLSNGKKPYKGSELQNIEQQTEKEDFFASLSRRTQEERIKRESEFNSLRDLQPGDQIPYSAGFVVKPDPDPTQTKAMKIAAEMVRLMTDPRFQCVDIYQIAVSLVSEKDKTVSATLGLTPSFTPESTLAAQLITAGKQQFDSDKRATETPGSALTAESTVLLNAITSPSQVSQQQTELSTRALGRLLATASPLSEQSVKETVTCLRPSPTNSSEIETAKPEGEKNFGKPIEAGSPLARALGFRG